MEAQVYSKVYMEKLKFIWNRKTQKSEHSIKGENRDFPGGPLVKNSLARAGDSGSVPGPGRSHMSLALKPVNPHYWSPHAVEPVLCNRRGHGV